MTEPTAAIEPAALGRNGCPAAPSERFLRGLGCLKELDPALADRLCTSLADVAPDFATYAVEFPFGDIYARPGLDLKTRQMVTVAALTALGHTPAQLKIHIGAALNVGCSKDEIVEAVMQIAVYAGFPAALNGLAVLKEVLATSAASNEAAPSDS